MLVFSAGFVKYCPSNSSLVSFPPPPHPCVNKYTVIIINVPVVFMARYVMVLRGATSLRGSLDDVAPLKTIKNKRHKNNWYIDSFMYPSAVV